MSILVITTGGTIGCLPYDNPSKPPEYVPVPPIGVDLIADALRDHFPSVSCRCISLEPRDSKNIDEAYRANMMKIISESEETKILITTGTDRILQIAEYFFYECAEHPKPRAKTIILTGAMVPLTNGDQSDGFRNLQFSLNELQKTDGRAGVFIVLCDYEQPSDETGAWGPRLYPYEPGAYEKVYMPNARYNRLRRA